MAKDDEKTILCMKTYVVQDEHRNTDKRTEFKAGQGYTLPAATAAHLLRKVYTVRDTSKSARDRAASFDAPFFIDGDRIEAMMQGKADELRAKAEAAEEAVKAAEAAEKAADTAEKAAGKAKEADKAKAAEEAEKAGQAALSAREKATAAEEAAAKAEAELRDMEKEVKAMSDAAKANA